MSHEWLIYRALVFVFASYERIKEPFLKQAYRLLIALGALAIMVWYLIGFFLGHWLRNLIVLGIWMFLEMLYYWSQKPDKVFEDGQNL